jgi:di/tricarboxylate transporter
MTPESLQAPLALLILAGAIYSFVRETLPPDLTALLAILALLLTGILDPIEAFSGFSHPATVSVAAVLVLSAGLDRTGALTFLARRVLAPLGRSELLLTGVLMAAIATLSAFVNNTAAVAVFIPAVLEVCRRTGASPGRILMPMSHAATFGGMCTLIGTSTNLAAHEYARSKGLAGFSMFELGQVGLPMLVAGFAYILLVGRWFLPHRPLDEAAFPQRTGPYLAELVVTPNSPWIGREANGARLRRDFDLELVELIRDGRSLGPGTPGDRASGDAPVALRYAQGDRVVVRGPLDRLLALSAGTGMELHRPGDRAPSAARAAPPGEGGAAAPLAGRDAAAPGEPQARLPLTEVVVLPGSPLIGRTLPDVRFAERFDAIVLAIHRPGEEAEEPPATTRLHAGDVLVVEGEPGALKALAETRGFLLVGSPSHPEHRSPRHLAIAVATLAGVVLAAALGWAPIVTAATGGCAALMLTGCLRPRDAYRAIDWSIVFLLAGALALGLALEKTGVTGGLASLLARLAGVAGPHALVAGFFVAAMLVSELISNSGTVLLLAPVAVSAAGTMGLDPMPLLAAVTFGASAAFAMPIGYQTNLMIFRPGGYRFRDYLVMGVPLDLLLAGMALWLIPAYWPLVP